MIETSTTRGEAGRADPCKEAPADGGLARTANARVLMAAHPTVGHLGALRAIGARLLARGHAVAIASTHVRLPLVDLWPEPMRAATRLPAAIASDGIGFFALPPPLAALWHGARLPGKTGHDELEVALAFFASGIELQARAIARHARSWGAEVVVADYLMPAAMLGAELAGLPHVAVYHSALPFPVEGEPPFGSSLPPEARGTAEWTRAAARLRRLFGRFDARVAAAARSLGLPAPREGLLGAPLSRDLNLLATTPALEPGLGPLEGPVLMVGPCLPPVTSAQEDDPALTALPREGRRLYVSLGTVFNGQPAVFDRILDGLEGPGVHVVVSAGASYERLRGRSGPRTHLFRQVPQLALLRRVDAVVTHGGNNTVQECLAAGRPMVVVPFGGDQIENARRVERLGVGVGLSASRLDAASVRAAVERACAPEAVARARELAASLAGLDGAGVAAEAVLGLVGARRRPVSGRAGGDRDQDREEGAAEARAAGGC